MFLADTYTYFGATGIYPCFGFLVTSPLGFKARVGSALFALRMRMLFTLPDIHLGGRNWLGIEQAIACTEDKCTTIVPATQPALAILLR